MFEVDKKLNIVLRAKRSDGSVVHVHAQPIKYETYETYYRLICRSAVTMYADGLGAGACTRVAMLSLRTTAKELDGGMDGGPYSIGCEALLNEIIRLTNIGMATAKGWETIPFQTIIQQKLLEPATIREVLNALAFFTIASWFHQSEELKNVYQILQNFGAQITSSSVTEYVSSLSTSIADESIGEKETQSPMPPLIG